MWDIMKEDKGYRADDNSYSYLSDWDNLARREIVLQPYIITGFLCSCGLRLSRRRLCTENHDRDHRTMGHVIGLRGCPAVPGLQGRQEP
jgi:hypothetical protein